MDSIDHKIITELQKDGRLSNLELSEKINLTPTPCLRRVKILEQEGIISRYTAVVDEKAYGLNINAFVRVRLKSHCPGGIAEFERSIACNENVVECHIMTGPDDYLMRVLVEDMGQFEYVIRNTILSIPAISSIDTSIAFGSVKRYGIYPKIIKK